MEFALLLHLKRVKQFFIFLLLVVAGRATAQCHFSNGDSLDHFYLKAGDPHRWEEYELDPAFQGHEGFIRDEKRFFDSLQFIPFTAAIKTACDEKKMPVYTAILEVNKDKSKTVWRLEGEEHIKFGGYGAGNATIRHMVLILDANTWSIISYKKEKYRAIVDF